MINEDRHKRERRKKDHHTQDHQQNNHAALHHTLPSQLHVSLALPLSNVVQGLASQGPREQRRSPMRLVSYEQNGRRSIGALTNAGVIDLPAASGGALPAGMLAFL